ncbi:unnamed protein product, partial [Hapterophycus canaliculatus]
MALRTLGAATRALASRPPCGAQAPATVGAARSIHRTASSYDEVHQLGQHRDTPDNNETTYFDFTDENYARVEKIMAKYPANYRQASIIPLLDLAQRQ